MAHYSLWGKIVSGFIGLFATAIFGIPIGLLGAGFEKLVNSEHEDTPDETQRQGVASRDINTHFASESEILCYKIVNGIGSNAAVYFEISIYLLIVASVTVGIIQTVDGFENAFPLLEMLAVLVFTIEYVMRLIGVVVDSEFTTSNGSNRSATWSRLRYMVSFYSIIDLLAILPFYLALLFPGSWFDHHGKYL